MTHDYFRKCGPLNAQRIGTDHMRWEVPIEGDEDGRVARQCLNDSCSPGYFKVLFGTGITEERPFAFCPYCRRQDDPGAFLTEEQKRFFEDVLLSEATHAFSNMMKSSFRNSKHVTYKPGRLPTPRVPFEDEVQRNVVCPHCTLDHAVYGLAWWCPDCGTDIFLPHVEAEVNVVRAMLEDIGRRRKQLGRRVAAKVTEDCLEDVVSIYEAVLKALINRYMQHQGKSKEEIEHILTKTVRNGFQNIERSGALMQDIAGISLFDAMDDAALNRLKSTFEMRHPITHNLAVFDRKYLEQSLAAEREGREVRVAPADIENCLDTCSRIFAHAHSRLLGSTNADGEHTA